MSTNTPKRNSRRLRRFLKANEAVSALEYAILVGVVSVALLTAFATFNNEVQNAISQIGTNIKTNTQSTGTTPSPF